jgi:hypothetical protein
MQKNLTFLKPDSIDVAILCAACRSPLWRMKVLAQHQGTVLSTEHTPLSPSVPKFSDKILDCPVCNRPFYRLVNKVQVYSLRDMKTGQHFEA